MPGPEPEEQPQDPTQSSEPSSTTSAESSNESNVGSASSEPSSAPSLTEDEQGNLYLDPDPYGFHKGEPGFVYVYPNQGGPPNDEEIRKLA